MIKKILTTAILAFAIPTTASAWHNGFIVDAFDGKKTHYKYALGERLTTFGNSYSKDTPKLFLYEPTPMVSKEGVAYFTRYFQFLPVDTYICVGRDKTVPLDIKLDGVLQTSDTPAMVMGEIKYLEAKTHKQLMAPTNTSKDRFEFQGTKDYVSPIGIVQAYADLPFKMETANSMVIRYTDTCGNGGVFKFDLTQGDVTAEVIQ